MSTDASLMPTPGPDGRFGRFGGRFVPETLIPACEELEVAFTEAWARRNGRAIAPNNHSVALVADESSGGLGDALRQTYVGRP